METTALEIVPSNQNENVEAYNLYLRRGCLIFKRVIWTVLKRGKGRATFQNTGNIKYDIK